DDLREGDLTLLFGREIVLHITPLRVHGASFCTFLQIGYPTRSGCQRLSRVQAVSRSLRASCRSPPRHSDRTALSVSLSRAVKGTALPTAGGRGTSQPPSA